jgi:hypothetical protein
MGDDELCGRGIYGVFFGTVQQCVKVGNHQHSHSWVRPFLTLINHKVELRDILTGF